MIVDKYKLAVALGDQELVRYLQSRLTEQETLNLVAELTHQPDGKQAATTALRYACGYETPRARRPSHSPGKRKPPVHNTVVIAGQRVAPGRSQADCLANALAVVAKYKPMCMDWLAELNDGGVRHFVARKPSELYDNPSIKGSRRIPGTDWHVGTHASWESKLRLIAKACQLAGLQWHEVPVSNGGH